MSRETEYESLNFAADHKGTMPMLELPTLAITTESTTLQRLLKRAERQIEQRRYHDAITSLQRAIATGADEYTCTLHIAAIHSFEQCWDGAFGALEKAISLDPHRTVGHELLMDIAIEAGDPERALAAGHALIKLAPRHLAAHNALGAIYMQRGDIDAAIRVTNTLIRLDPGCPAHHFKKALLYQHKGEVALAVEEFTSAYRMDADGMYGDAARDALENLDTFQINQVLTLAMEDIVFRTKLIRDTPTAAAERGFALTDMGNHILGELCEQLLTEPSSRCRPLRYN
jgi:tetratricopeptide (TPR) repeat protein